MATYGWRKARTVKEGLFAESERFSFVQAVRILERLYPQRTPVGEEIETGSEVVRFKSSPSLAFPPSEIRALRPPRAGGAAEMEVGFLGLAGALGPLPTSFTERILERVRRGDATARDFLDLFNHRLVSLFFRAREKYRPPLSSRPPDEGRVAGCLYALEGLGTPGLRGRMGVRDRSLLYYAGLLVGTQRSMVGLERMLGHYFETTARVEPFLGAWYSLSDDQLTRLGSTESETAGQNRALGSTAVLGRRVWDQQAVFELRLGPLTYRQLLELLPASPGYGTLCALVRFYVGDELDFRFRLVVAAAEVPATRLGRAGDARLGWSARLDSARAEPRLGGSGGSRLGWTSWLSTRTPDADDEQVRLAGVRA